MLGLPEDLWLTFALESDRIDALLDYDALEVADLTPANVVEIHKFRVALQDVRIAHISELEGTDHA